MEKGQEQQDCTMEKARTRSPYSGYVFNVLHLQGSRKGSFVQGLLVVSWCTLP